MLRNGPEEDALREAGKAKLASTWGQNAPAPQNVPSANVEQTPVQRTFQGHVWEWAGLSWTW
eukprot:11160392-Lingulodinium_polyedra.AAC.1